MPEFNLVRNGNEAVLKLGEKLTALDVPELQAELKRGIGDGIREIVFDLSATTTLDSTAIGLLIAANNSLAAKQGRIRLVNVSPNLINLLQSMRLAERLNAAEVANG
jgi:anti-anti-sigma factor